MSDKVKIFISYARLDTDKVLPLYQRLQDAGFDPWLDREHLLPGVKWRTAIEQALREADFFLLCLSNQSSNRRGFIQREINAALDLWEERLQDDIYFIPLRLEECEIPARVDEFHCVNWFETDGWERLMKALQHQSGKLRAHRPPATAPPVPVKTASDPMTAPVPFAAPVTEFPFVSVRLDDRGEVASQTRGSATGEIEDLGGGVLIEMIQLKGGEFWMGSTEADAQIAFAEAKRYYDAVKEEWYKHETPRHRVALSPFLMGRFPVTQAQWFEVMGDLPAIEAKLRGDDHPVVNVSWDEAVAFCQELSRRTGHQYRLPTEAEWEYACRAGPSTPFAFGPTLTPKVANYCWSHPYANGPQQEPLQKTVTVGSLGVTNPFGLFDMHGNIWEWCSDWYNENYYQECRSKGAVKDPHGPSTGADRILRGGGWFNYAFHCRSAYRLYDPPGDGYDGLGFRLVRIGR
jgi:formylglycine-generating enzyme required for sulfatase activity